MIRTIRAERQNGSPVNIIVTMKKVPDNTATGTIWTAPPVIMEFYKLTTGEPVEILDPENAEIIHTGEKLRIIRNL